LSTGVVVVEGNDLCSCHFQILDIASSNVSLVWFRLLSKVFRIFGIDTNDWILGGQCGYGCQEDYKYKELNLHHVDLLYRIERN
jgi:hypothetical protein